MKQYDVIIIGFGKAGKTLAANLAAAGKSVALVEKSPAMYGGTCINAACIPTKFLENAARQSALSGGDFVAKASRYRQAIEAKQALTAMLRKKNYDKLIAAGVTVFDGTAAFADAHSLDLALNDGTAEKASGKIIIVNTGSRPLLPPIAGLDSCRRVFTSETLMEVETLPRSLVIIGGGYIGMEFASYYANFGTTVTILQDGEKFLPREDVQIAGEVRRNLEKHGIRFAGGVRVTSVHDSGDGAADISFTEGGLHKEMKADAVLAAAGRRASTDGLRLDAAGIELTERGGIKTDERLRTTVPHIFAAGDVTGGLQFTYISLDDSRIITSQLTGDGSRTTLNRGIVPYSVFIDPPLARVGLTEEEARRQGFSVKTATLAAAAIPKAHILGRTAGLLKAVTDAKTGQILGVHLFCAEAPEMINEVKQAIDAKLPYTVLRDAVFTHPTMSEAFNDLFAALS